MATKTNKLIHVSISIGDDGWKHADFSRSADFGSFTKGYTPTKSSSSRLLDTLFDCVECVGVLHGDGSMSVRIDKWLK